MFSGVKKKLAIFLFVNKETRWNNIMKKVVRGGTHMANLLSEKQEEDKNPPSITATGQLLVFASALLSRHQQLLAVISSLSY